jgi:membrane protein required for colicin V production
VSVGPFDLGAGVVALVLVLYGAWRGIIRISFWFAGWAIGWWVALRYSEPLALRLGARRELLADHPDLLRLACFIFLLIVVVFLASLLGWLLSRLVKLALMGPMDRLAGAGLGLLMAIVLVCAATIPILAAWPPDGGWLMSQSVLAPYAVAGGEYLKVAAAEPWKSRFSAGARAVFSKDTQR